MGKNTIIHRDELLNLIKKAKSRIRILGAVAFDLPYDLFKDDWYERINKAQLQVEIICESEATLNFYSLISSNRMVSGEDRSYEVGDFLKLKNEPLQKVREFFQKKKCNHIEPEEDSNEKQCFKLKTCYQIIKEPVINIDNDYYISKSFTLFCTLQRFEKIKKSHQWYEEYCKYFHAYFDAEKGACKFYSTEITAKDNKTEVIYVHNDQRQVLGQAPRDSFLDMPHPKNVVWGLIFSRDGRILIHQRGKNAKDNQGMWDKSIGGHIDIVKDTVDSSLAAAREMLEELYKVELEAQGGHTKAEDFKPDEDIPINIGVWRKELPDIVKSPIIRDRTDDVFYFRINYKFSKTPIDSPRLLPDGSIMSVRVFPDVFCFIMRDKFEATIGNLKNSKYKLLELSELNDAFISRKMTIVNQQGQIEEIEFNPTPDLKQIKSGELWVDLKMISSYLKDDQR